MSDTLTAIMNVVANGYQSLPAPIQRNLLQAAETLIIGAVNVPASWLSMVAAEFQAKEQGHRLLAQALAENAASLVGEDPELAKRALLYFVPRIMKEQANREAVVKEAVASLQANPVSNLNAVPPISDDWLHQFQKLAESKSTKDVQGIFGRILAGEICKPGSFSPITLEVLGRLVPTTANLFEQVANRALVIEGANDILITSILDENGNIEDLFSLISLMRLEEYGLIQTTGLYAIDPELFKKLPSTTLGGQRVLISHSQATIARSKLLKRQSAAVHFTGAGQELASVVLKTFDQCYAKKLRNGLSQIGIELTFPDIDIDAEDQTIPKAKQA